MSRKLASLSTTIVSRPSRDIDEGNSTFIRVHHGLIAWADRPMKDALVRDRLAETEKVLCFEMEAAGLMANLSSLIIREVSEYSCSHKNDKWQGYAAAIAAAYAKELLNLVSARWSTLGKESELSNMCSNPGSLADIGAIEPLYRGISSNPVHPACGPHGRANTSSIKPQALISIEQHECHRHTRSAEST